jgi:hypothetical protein
MGGCSGELMWAYDSQSHAVDCDEHAEEAGAIMLAM